MTNKDPLYKRLSELMEAGVVWLEGNEYVGRATDGTIVNLGHISQTTRLLAYLSAHPTPADW